MYKLVPIWPPFAVFWISPLLPQDHLYWYPSKMLSPQLSDWTNPWPHFLFPSDSIQGSFHSYSLRTTSSPAPLLGVESLVCRQGARRKHKCRGVSESVGGGARGARGVSNIDTRFGRRKEDGKEGSLEEDCSGGLRKRKLVKQVSINRRQC